MQTSSELVRAIVRWAILLIAADGRNSRLALPRLSQISLGRMMSRSDSQTTIAIALEIAAIERREPTELYLCALVSQIRSGWGETSSPPRRRGREALVDRAELVMSALRRCGTRSDQTLVETCVMLRSWKQAEQIWHGRVWHSVRDDFDAAAHRFWLKEHRMLEETSDLIREHARMVRERGRPRKKF